MPSNFAPFQRTLLGRNRDSKRAFRWLVTSCWQLEAGSKGKNNAARNVLEVLTTRWEGQRRTRALYLTPFRRIFVFERGHLTSDTPRHGVATAKVEEDVVRPLRIVLDPFSSGYSTKRVSDGARANCMKYWSAPVAERVCWLLPPLRFSFWYLLLQEVEHRGREPRENEWTDSWYFRMNGSIISGIDFLFVLIGGFY